MSSFYERMPIYSNQLHCNNSRTNQNCDPQEKLHSSTALRTSCDLFKLKSCWDWEHREIPLWLSSLSFMSWVSPWKLNHPNKQYPRIQYVNKLSTLSGWGDSGGPLRFRVTPDLDNDGAEAGRYNRKKAHRKKADIFYFWDKIRIGSTSSVFAQWVRQKRECMRTHTHTHKSVYQRGQEGEEGGISAFTKWPLSFQWEDKHTADRACSV